MTPKHKSSLPPADGLWFVYLLECINGRLYTGITTDLTRRFKTHCSGKGAMFTRLNAPKRYLAAQRCPDRGEAQRLEARVKQLTPTGKRALIQSWPYIFLEQ